MAMEPARRLVIIWDVSGSTINRLPGGSGHTVFEVGRTIVESLLAKEDWKGSAKGTMAKFDHKLVVVTPGSWAFMRMRSTSLWFDDKAHEPRSDWMRGWAARRVYLNEFEGGIDLKPGGFEDWEEAFREVRRNAVDYSGRTGYSDSPGRPVDATQDYLVVVTDGASPEQLEKLASEIDRHRPRDVAVFLISGADSGLAETTPYGRSGTRVSPLTTVASVTVVDGEAWREMLTRGSILFRTTEDW